MPQAQPVDASRGRSARKDPIHARLTGSAGAHGGTRSAPVRGYGKNRPRQMYADDTGRPRDDRLALLRR